MQAECEQVKVKTLKSWCFQFLDATKDIDMQHLVMKVALTAANDNNRSKG